MNLETKIKLVDNIIGNEFWHIAEENEFEDLENNKRIQENSKKREEITEALKKALPKELQGLLIDYEDCFANELAECEEYYFRKGVGNGLGKLNYLNECGLGKIV